jgi:hypothetical protein
MSAGILAVLALHEVAAQPDRSDLRTTPPALRAIWYERALAELTGCQGPEARTGVLRAHCQAEARFIVQFPECDAGCQRLVRMTHARSANPR